MPVVTHADKGRHLDTHFKSNHCCSNCKADPRPCVEEACPHNDTVSHTLQSMAHAIADGTHGRNLQGAQILGSVTQRKAGRYHASSLTAEFSLMFIYLLVTQSRAQFTVCCSTQVVQSITPPTSHQVLHKQSPKAKVLPKCPQLPC